MLEDIGLPELVIHSATLAISEAVNDERSQVSESLLSVMYSWMDYLYTYFRASLRATKIYKVIAFWFLVLSLMLGSDHTIFFLATFRLSF